MKDQFRPENPGIRLVEADAVPPMPYRLGGGELVFAVETHPYETQDLFHTILLSGARPEKVEEVRLLEPWRGLTVIDDALVVDDFKTMLDEHKDLFHIAIEGMPGFGRPGKSLRCDMHIDGFETFYTSVMGSSDLGTEDAISITYTWRSADPNDLHIYCLMAAPHDTALLNRLQFSFHVIPANDNNMSR